MRRRRLRQSRRRPEVWRRARRRAAGRPQGRRAAGGRPQWRARVVVRRQRAARGPRRRLRARWRGRGVVRALRAHDLVAVLAFAVAPLVEDADHLSGLEGSTASSCGVAVRRAEPSRLSESRIKLPSQQPSVSGLRPLWTSGPSPPPPRGPKISCGLAMALLASEGTKEHKRSALKTPAA